jgi:hypothetical protein
MSVAMRELGCWMGWDWGWEVGSERGEGDRRGRDGKWSGVRFGMR